MSRKKDYVVRVEEEVRFTYFIDVKASSEEEAIAKAKNADLSWTCVGDRESLSLECSIAEEL